VLAGAAFTRPEFDTTPIAATETRVARAVAVAGTSKDARLTFSFTFTFTFARGIALAFRSVAVVATAAATEQDQDKECRRAESHPQPPPEDPTLTDAGISRLARLRKSAHPSAQSKDFYAVSIGRYFTF
jgi:hypothetical protein